MAQQGPELISEKRSACEETGKKRRFVVKCGLQIRKKLRREGSSAGFSSFVCSRRLPRSPVCRLRSGTHTY